RVAYLIADEAIMYSYKLKKSGLRIQYDIVYISTRECHDFNDEVMLFKMAIEKNIRNLDCITLDGGYAQFLHGIVEKSG
ncbi:hypothetical protein BX616_008955, partial [Lobosporangium transversale]